MSSLAVERFEGFQRTMCAGFITLCLAFTTHAHAAFSESLAHGATDLTGQGLRLPSEASRAWEAQLAYGDWTLVLRTSDKGLVVREPINTVQLNYRRALLDDKLMLLGRLHAGGAMQAGRGAADAAPGHWQAAEVQAMLKAWAGHDLRLRLDHALSGDLSSLPSERLAAPVFEVTPLALAVTRLDVQDKIRLGRKLDATVGARIDKTRERGSHLTSRATLAWRTGSRSNLRASYGRSTPMMPPGVASWSVQRERHEAVELQADYQIGAQARVSALGFMRTQEQGEDSPSGMSALSPWAASTTKGAELAIDSLWASGMRLRGLLSGQQALREGEGLRQEWKARANLWSPLALWGASGGGEASYEAARGSLSGVRWPARLFLDLNLSMPMATGLDLSLRLLKLVEVQMGNQTAQALTDPARDPRGAQVQLSYRF
jgi:TonB dependent receptor